MPSGKQKQYFREKTNEAYLDLTRVSSIYKFQDPFFKQPMAIPIPKVDKVDSFDTWLNNASNIFKTLLHFTEFGTYMALENIEQNAPFNPIQSFCLEFLASIIDSIAALIPEEKKEIEIEMQPMGQ
ncbi:hypothetical protein DGG96_03145 [Legionella qingyii]|uniref:Uncharacterized protein n=1 Tax=Legionella qingyii TaxID=2184757 RepID=A0A317U705_9GAMM|nr:hypothetical protein [Legionella qingyii]PWY56322.1 hypothetical protein DGG96_06045 [Legionella qingyii]PWY57322.1 hypothetical protein DGG96_03145 [Legionella qingyii]RUR24838.1 hypothetical protein ELY20_03540 [Legionella qingyii]RUR28888.1 hypothetical protein ELY16_02440 [Legionella qingyii]